MYDAPKLRKDFLNSICNHRILFPNIKRAFSNIGKGIKCENKIIIYNIHINIYSLASI